MATAAPGGTPLRAWVHGARPRTLPAAVAPVLVGTAVAGAPGSAGDAVWWKALLALLVSLALQVGVNYANDYSDGVRGTDAERVGPMRLVGSGAATPAAVKRAAFAAFGLAALAGLVLAVTTSLWLVVVGTLAIAAAWYYTGGSSPYGYHGLGEVMVFAFFGLVAVTGTAYVQTASLAPDVVVPALAGSLGVGSLACAILVANNLRDLDGDAAAGKRTLAVRLGDARTRSLYAVLVGAAALALAWFLVTTDPAALAGFVFLGPAVPAVRRVLSGARGPALVPVLAATGLAELLWALGAALGVALSTVL